MNDARLRILVLDIASKTLLHSLKHNSLFSITVGKLRTVKLSMKPDVIVFEYSKIYDSNAMQKRMINLIYKFKIKPIIIAYMDSWEYNIQKQAELFGVDKTFSKAQIDEVNNSMIRYISNYLLDI